MRARATESMSATALMTGMLCAGTLALPCYAAPATPPTAAAPAAGAPTAASARTTLFYDAHVFTAEPAHPYAAAVAIRGDRILAVGALPDVERVAGPGARRVDLEGRFLMPGMIDAHAHPIDGGLTLLEASYPDTKDSVPDLARFVAQQLAGKHSLRGDVLIINDLDLGFWTHTAELNAALSEGPYAHQPIVLYGSDGHTAWGNRALLERAGITAAFIRGLPADERRYYGADAQSNPNGFVVDKAHQKLDASVPQPSAERLREALKAALHYMHQYGITGWLDAAPSNFMGLDPARPDDAGVLPVYQSLARAGELRAHVVAYPVVKPDAGLGQIDVVETLKSRFEVLPDFGIPGLKVFADGVVEVPSHTAALTKPYLDTRRMAPLFFQPKNMNALVTEADRRGLIVHVHAIGDLAVKAALDAFAAARKANPSGTLPDTITHVQFADPEDVPRFGELHVYAALQLLWAIADPSTNEQVKPYIDAAIYRTMYPARSILESGGVIAGASDWPVSSANPFLAIYQAETRLGPQGVLLPRERMPREAMLYAYTREAARVLNQLDRIGSLAPGKLADLVLLDRDVLVAPAAEMRDAKVVWTMFGGRVVYGNGP
jgi:predicted amidohydrolase YtcJ